MMKLYHADNGLSSPVRYSHGIWWINHPALCKPTSGRFLVMRQSREACAGYMGYPPCKWIVNLFRYSGVLTTKCALSQAREELPYPPGGNSTSDEAHLSRVCFFSQGKRQAWK